MKHYAISVVLGAAMLLPVEALAIQCGGGGQADFTVATPGGRFPYPIEIGTATSSVAYANPSIVFCCKVWGPPASDCQNYKWDGVEWKKNGDNYKGVARSVDAAGADKPQRSVEQRKGDPGSKRTPQ